LNGKPWLDIGSFSPFFFFNRPFFLKERKKVFAFPIQKTEGIFIYTLKKKNRAEFKDNAEVKQNTNDAMPHSCLIISQLPGYSQVVTL